jgi:tetratricopeptide (TPR) repeat protein
MRKFVFATILICANQAFSDCVLANDGELKNIGKIQMKLTLPDSKLESQRIDLQNLIRNKLKTADIPTDDASATQLQVKIEPGRQTHIVLSTTEVTPLPNNPSIKKEVSIWTREATCNPKEVSGQLSTLLDAFAIQYLKDNKNSTSLAADVSPSQNISATLREFSPPPPGESIAENSAEATRLNNDGVRALQIGDYDTAVIKLQAALKLNPGYVVSRQNLAIVLNNFGLQRRLDFNTARRFFQWAVYIDPTNSVSHQNLDGIIRRAGKRTDTA